MLAITKWVHASHRASRPRPPASNPRVEHLSPILSSDQRLSCQTLSKLPTSFSKVEDCLGDRLLINSRTISRIIDRSSVLLGWRHQLAWKGRLTMMRLVIQFRVVEPFIVV
jgi:hypothetical protein